MRDVSVAYLRWSYVGCCINIENDAQDQNRTVYANVPHEEHWCHHFDGEGLQPVDTLMAMDPAEHVSDHRGLVWN